MNLTVEVGRASDGRFRASIIEMPGVFFLASTESEVRERMGRLVHALRSPHISIERILPDGDVILTLRRDEGEEIEDDELVRNGSNGSSLSFSSPYVM